MAKKSKNPRLEDLLSDPEQLRQMHEQLYSRKPLLEQGSPFAQLLQTMVNAALDGEVLGHVAETRAQGEENKRNGYTDKTILSEVGPLSIRTPRDRQGSFEPQLVPKRERELSSGLDTQILALYAQGNSVEDIKRLLQTMFGVDISAGKISAITDQVLPVIQEWRNRRLLEFYTVVYMDAIHFKVRHEGKYSSRAFYTVYSVDVHGNRDLLGMYMSDNEGANQWGLVLEDLKFRGVEDVLVFCTDDLAGFSEAMNDVYPTTVVQKCLVHKMRNTTRFVDDKDMKAVVRGLKAVYKADTREAAATALEAFEVDWGHKYSSIVVSWRRDWDELMAFLDFPIALRRMIYTTNPVEAVHRIIRKLIKGKAAWASDTALIKQVYLSLMHNEKSWRKQVYGWKAIQRDLVKLYWDRVTKHMGPS